MTISQNLLFAIFSMDSYNRGYNAGIIITGDQIGSNSSILLDANNQPLDQPASFFAQAYQLANGDTVISYRGTDNPTLSADIPAWTTGISIYETAQAQLAAQFYKQINNNSISANPNIMLTGHSLGGGLAGLVGSIYGVAARFFDNMNRAGFAGGEGDAGGPHDGNGA